jgi:hypothetical protein
MHVLSVVTFAFLATFVLCQVQQDMPVHSKLLPTQNAYKVVTLGKVDHEPLLREDENKFKGEGPHALRYAKVLPVNISLTNSGTWETVPTGKIWRVGISTDGAYFTQVLFKRYMIPPKASLHIYNSRKTIGAFTTLNNKEDGVFATRPIEGDSFTVEYFEPTEFAGLGEIEIDGVSHAYRNLFGTRDDSERCNINTMCPQASDKKDQTRSVVALLARGDVFCTGAMINNHKKNGKQLMLTANHCGVAANNWIVIFNYESATCARGGRWEKDDTASGVKSLSLAKETDFQITEVVEKIPRRYNAYLTGFNAVDTPSPTSFSIHHPTGAPKKVTITNRPVIHSSWRRRPTDPKTHWEIPLWAEGITEPGSSGAPIFNNKKQITGQLEGGKSRCSRMNGDDSYGKLAWSWTHGSTPTNRLREHLDPDNTKQLELDGMELRSADEPRNELAECIGFCTLKKSSDCVHKCFFHSK